jgi:iron complex outermembrane receptor protein
MATHLRRIGLVVRRVALPVVVICGAWVASGAAGVVYAQGIEEVIVTARKRAENLQDVPLSIAALTSEQIRELGIRNNYDVAAFTPNFNTVQRVGRAGDRPVIRGMANPPDPNQGEPNASYFIDGVFVSSSIATATTASMERVEVLRGPQSAQFGRATFSGAVNYVTRKPTNDFEGELNARYGTSDEMQLAGWVSGPIVRDRLLFLVSASHEQYGGQWNNNLQPDSAFVNGGTADFVFDGQNTEGDTSELGEEETSDLLAKLTWTPADSSEINLKFGYTEGDDSLYPTNVLPNDVSDFANLNCFIPDDPAEPWYETSTGEFCGEFIEDQSENRKNLPDLRNGIFANSPLGELSDEERSAAPAKPGLRRETHRLMGEWIQDFGDWTSVLRGSYSKDEFDNVIDLDQQEVRAVWGLFAFYINDEVQDQSLEFSVSSPVDRAVRGKLGGYYFDREDTRIERSFTGPAPVFGVEPGADFGEPRTVRIENTSVFGSIGVDLAPRWTLDLEARFGRDTKDIESGQRSLADNSVQPQTAELRFSSFTPRITLNYQPTDDMLAYVLLAKGNKPGDFNKDQFRSDIPAEFTEFQINCEIGDEVMIGGLLVECTEQLKSDLTVEEEEQWTYEFGLKTAWLDGSVIANLAVFYIDWENQALTETADTPNSSGGLTALQTLRNVGQSKITGLELETSWIANENLLLFLNYGLADGEFVEGALPNFGETTGTDGDISGHTIPDTPTHSVVTGFEATSAVSPDLTVFLRGNFLYESKRYNNASNLNWMDDRSLVNVRFGLRSEAWTATVYARNLLDDDTPIGALGFSNFAINPITTSANAPNDGAYPRLYSIVPQRGRDFGLEFSYRFGR